MLSSILPAWVEPDPLRSRATDALGLQAVADRLADRLLPGLSVLTTRARYFTFLSWAREESGRDHDEQGIHRHEVTLAFSEGTLSTNDPDHAARCQFVGSRNIQPLLAGRIPADPRQVYKIPAWRAYRASMIALGLLESGPRFSLTDEGMIAAQSFRRAVRPKTHLTTALPERACLSEISGNERRHLRNALGISLRGKIDLDSTDALTRRAAFARQVRRIFWRDGLSPETVLPRYEHRGSGQLAEPIQTLRAAATWERLSIGLNTLFTVWVRAIDAGRRRTVERTAADLLTRGLRPPVLESVSLADEEAALGKAIASLRYAIRLHDHVRDHGMQLPSDEPAFELARTLIGRSKSPRSRIADGLAQMLARHRAVKGDDVWLREASGGNLEIARDAGESWTIPTNVQPHAYRMTAFGQVAEDLGGI